MKIRQIIQDAIQIKKDILSDETILEQIKKASEIISGSLKNGHKILFCGNGGSAADAQHLASELSGRFFINRPPLHAEALHVNTSYLTAVANDISFDEIYARALEAKAQT